jgi:hypothetical protein
VADGKHPGGRPTVATPENVERAFEYVNGGWEKAAMSFQQWKAWPLS